MTGYASRRCSTDLSQFSNRYWMMPTSDIGEGDRHTTQQGVERDPERTRVDRRCRLERLFGSVEHEKLLTLLAQWIADGRVLRLIEANAEGRKLW